MSNGSSSGPELVDFLARLGLGFGLGRTGVEWSCGAERTDFALHFPDVRLAAGTRFAAVCFDAIEKEKKSIRAE